MTSRSVEAPPSGASPLLGSKLCPPTIRAPVIRRPRLLERVSRAVEGPLTVVSGPAGAGKTLLLASWLAERTAPGPVAWLTLDAQDDEPGVFWAYVVAALRRAGVALPEDVGEPIGARPVDLSFLVRLAGCLAAGPDPVVLVLDQCDVLADQEVLDGIGFLLRHAGPALRLVLLSRDEAPLPLHRFELHGDLTRIGGADLAFTRPEAEALLRQHGVALSADGLGRLLDSVRGWAAALRLSAVAMQRRPRPDEFVAALPTADATLTAYLLDEVLAQQPPEVREFLLRTSVPDTVCPDLADVLGDRRDSRQVLAALQSGNVLTEALDRAPGWYHYHPLLRRLLRAELAHQHPELVAELHGRTARWFQDAGMTAEAVRAAVAVQDWQLATAAVVQGLAVGALLSGQAPGLAASLEGLPAEETGPVPAVVRAALARARFDLPACREQLRSAELALLESGEDESGADTAPLLTSIAVVRALLARAEGDVETAETALAEGERQLARIPTAAAAHPEVPAVLLSSVGAAQLWAGRFAAAEETLRRGLAAARSPGCAYAQLDALGQLSCLEFRRGHLRRAARLASEVLSRADEVGLPLSHRTGAGHMTLAMIAVEEHDRAAARRHLDDAERTLGARRDPLVILGVRLLRAALHTGARDHRRALAALAAVPVELAGRPLPGWLAARVALTGAGIHLRQGHVQEAAALLDGVAERGPEWSVAAAAVADACGDRPRARQLLAAVLDGPPPDVDGSRIAAWVLTARMAAEERDRPAARDALGRALVLARPEGYRRVFAEAGPWLRELLRASPDLAAAHRWLGRPLVDPPLPGSEPDGLPPVVEPLTERERTVLERFAQGMSTEDVARDLFLSVNTVKTHQKNLYRKLAVARRNEAVRRARQLQLI